MPPSICPLQIIHPSELGVTVGQTINVKYYGRDPVTQRHHISRKALLSPPAHEDSTVVQTLLDSFTSTSPHTDKHSKSWWSPCNCLFISRYFIISCLQGSQSHDDHPVIVSLLVDTFSYHACKDRCVGLVLWCMVVVLYSYNYTAIVLCAYATCVCSFVIWYMVSCQLVYKIGCPGDV